MYLKNYQTLSHTCNLYKIQKIDRVRSLVKQTSYRPDPPQKSPSYSGSTLPPSTFLRINPTTTWCPELKTRSLILNDKRFTVECFHCYLSMTLILHVVFLNIINFEEVYWLRRCFFVWISQERKGYNSNR